MAGQYFYDPRPFYGQNAHTGLMPMEELFYGRSEPTVPYWMDQRMAPVPMLDDFYYPGGYKQMVRRPEIMHQQYVPQRGENGFLPYRRPELVRDDSFTDMYRRSPYNFNYGRGDGVAVAPGGMHPEVMRQPLVPLRAQDDTWVHTMSAPAPLGHGHQGFRGLPEPPPGAMPTRSSAPFGNGNDQFRSSGNDQYRQSELPMNNHMMSNNHSNSNGGGHSTKPSLGASGNGSFGHQNGSFGSQGQQQIGQSFSSQGQQQNGQSFSSQGQQNVGSYNSQGQQNAGSFNSQSKSLGQGGGGGGGGGAKSGAIQSSTMSKQNNNNSHSNSNSNQHSNAKRYNNDDSSSDSDDDDDYRNNGAMVKKHGHSSSNNGGKTSSGMHGHSHSHGGFESNSRGVKNSGLQSMISSKKSSSHGSHGGSKHSSGGHKHSSGPGSKISKLLGFQSDSSSSDDDDSYNSHSKKGSSKVTSMNQHHGTHVSSYQAPNYGSQPKQMQFSSQSKSVELQVPICCDNCERKVRTCLEKMDGVESVLCDQWNRKVIVYGNVKAENVLKRVRRVKKFSELWQNAKQHHFQNQQLQLQQLRLQY